MAVKKRRNKGVGFSEETISKAIDDLEDTLSEEEGETSETDDAGDTSSVEKALDSDEKKKKKTGKNKLNEGTPNGDADYDPDKTEASEKGTKKLEKKKSVSELLAENEEIQKAVSVSKGMESLVEETSEALEGMQKSITGFENKNVRFSAALAKAFAEMSEKVDGIQEALMELANKPLARKSVTTTTDDVIPRSEGGLKKGIDGQSLPVGGPNKFVILKAIEDLAIEGKITGQELITFESFGQMSKGVASLVSQKLNIKEGLKLVQNQ